MKIKLKKIIIYAIIALITVLVAMLGYYFGVKTNKIRQESPQSEINNNINNIAQPKEDAPLFETSFVDEAIKNVPGNVQWGLHLYNADYEYATPSSPVPSASVIKVFIMEYAYDLITKGEITPDTIIGSSTLYDLMYLMITQSDNNATNQLINHFGMENMNSYFKKMGYNDTVVQRRMLDFDAQIAGKENYTSINDVMKFLDKLYLNKDKVPYSDMLSIMLNQQRRNKIPSGLPNGVEVANKTGELSDVENDIAIVFDQNGDFAIAFLMTSLGNVDVAKDTIRQCTNYIYQSRNTITE